MTKKILCGSCKNPIAELTNEAIKIHQMKAVSKFEINKDNGSIDIQCHGCHNWNNIDKDDKHTINYKKKGEGILFNQERQLKR